MYTDIGLFVRWTVFAVFAVWSAMVLAYNLYVARRLCRGDENPPEPAPFIGTFGGVMAALVWPGEAGWVPFVIGPASLLCELPLLVDRRAADDGRPRKK
jgi:hypothetical protein